MGTMEEKLQKRMITDTMLSVRFRIEHEGFNYMRVVLDWLLSRESNRVQLKEAYRVVALRYGVTPEQVASSIKNLVKSDYHLQERINSLYGRTVVHDKPTPKMAIAFLFEYLRLYCDETQFED